MNKPLSGQKIAILAASGFKENEYIAIQKALKDTGAQTIIVSTDAGLINGMSNGQWGHNYMVDAQLNSALGVDYDVLIVLDGDASLTKLGKTAHTKRFVGSFDMAQKPIIVFGEANALENQYGLNKDGILHMVNTDEAAMRQFIDFISNFNNMDLAA